MTIGDERFTKRKERWKIVRVILQLLMLAALLFFVVTALFSTKTYQPYTEQSTTFAGDKGFIALSYFGVDRVGDSTLIGVERLREHLAALQTQGYVTVTQQDVIDYYASGKVLPEKSLLLMFEDGRRDTAIFTENILEELNFKATAMTYTEKFMLKDTKFLLPADLRELKDTTYWEMGSNGHRLAFINVFDRYENYLGELTPLKYSMLAPYLGRDYNHYLMDYVRDKDRIPKESYLQMKERVAFDYRQLADIYGKELGAVPELYVLMHSNTGAFGNAPQVSAANALWIKKLFKMNFNREGYSHNNKDSSIYDLTRMQPQAYWPTNHLLMRIKYDTNQPIAFVKGDEGRYQHWSLDEGAAEFKDGSIFLTSLPEGRGLIRLKDARVVADMKMTIRLRGNQLGKQCVYLRANEALTHYTAITLVNDMLVVTEKNGGAEQEIFKLALQELDGIKLISVPEDKKAAEERAFETFSRYADNTVQAKLYLSRLKAKQEEAAASVADGAAEYVPQIGPHKQGSRKLDIELKGNTLRIMVDGKIAAEELMVAGRNGGVALEAAWGGYGWSQRNLADDVYDGVFEGLVITTNTGKDKEKVLFDSRPQGWERGLFEINKIWNAVINWFITNL